MTGTTKSRVSGNQKGTAAMVADEDLSAWAAAMELFKRYASERPEVIALWAFGLGFVLGWKVKP